MSKKGIITGLSPEVCAPCLMSKCTRKDVKFCGSKCESTFDLIHMDIKGQHIKIMKMVRSVLKAAWLPNNLWSESAKMAIVIKNFSSSSLLKAAGLSTYKLIVARDAVFDETKIGLVPQISVPTRLPFIDT